MTEQTKDDQIRAWLVECGITEPIEITDHLRFLFDAEPVASVRLDENGTVVAVYK